MKNTKDERNSVFFYEDATAPGNNCPSGNLYFDPGAPPADVYSRGAVRSEERGLSARLKRVTSRLGEVLTSRVFLLSGLPLDKYLGVVGDKAASSAGKLAPVVLRTGPSEYRLIRPADGAVAVPGGQRSGVLRAHIYEIPEEMTDEALSCVALCTAKTSGTVEIALAYRYLVSAVGLDQKDLILWFGQSQSSISNKMRLCKLSGPVLNQFAVSGLSERHGRALLNIESEEMQLLALGNFIKRKSSSTKAEQLGKLMKDKSLKELGREAYSQLIVGALKDLPASLDSERKACFKALKQDICALKKSGVPVTVSSGEDGDFIELTIRIPKTAGGLLPEPANEPVAGDGAEDAAVSNKKPVISFPAVGAPVISFPKRDAFEEYVQDSAE